jgi:hypothetical protein
MAYVTARPQGRFEIRESRTTPKGPRSRTLATFRILDDSVVARAAARAERGIDVAALRRAALRVGAPVTVGSPADQTARELLRAIEAGDRPAPGLAALCARALGAPDVALGAGVPDSVFAVGPWIGVAAAQRGEVLRDLLLLADQLPARDRGSLTFPRLDSRLDSSS